MKKTLGLVVAAGIFASAAMGANLNVSVESGGSNTITAAPGEWVEYSVMGLLDTDADNRGLALAGFDLELLIEGTSTQGAALPQADEPTDVAMLNFAVPEGINNPAGFGGTDSNGKLLQVGGAQNTINNTLDCTVDADCPGASNTCDGGTCTASAPFPLGTVIENLGHTEIELAHGRFEFPSDRGEGCYVLTLTDLFANVISTTQNSPDFLATEAAGAGTIDNLTICAETCAVVTAGTWESVGPHTGARGVTEVGLEIADGLYVEPRRSGISKIVVNFSGAVDPVTAGPGSVGLSGCDVDGALDLSGIVIGTSLNPGNTQMVITFTPKLPGSEPSPVAGPLAAAYQISLNGITNTCGAPVDVGASRELRAVLGDAFGPPNGSGHVSSADAGLSRSFAAAGVDPIDPGNILHVRADVTGDGKVNSADAGLIRSMAAQGRDGRTLTCP